MKILLASDGDTVFKFLNQENLAGKRLAYITTASFGKHLDGSPLHQDYIKKERFLLKSLAIQSDEYNLIDRSLLDFKSIFASYQYIYVTGGNTYFLLKTFKDLGLDKLISDLVKHNHLTYLGSSAGSYIACPTIEPATWSVPQRHFRYGLKDLTALNLVPFLVKVHYTESKRQAIANGIQHSTYQTYVLKDGQAILYENNHLSIFGNQDLVQI